MPTDPQIPPGASPLPRSRQAFLAAKRTELHAPLQVILDLGQLLLADAQTVGPPQLSEDLARIQAAALELLHLVNELLSVERLAGGVDFSAVQSRVRHDLRSKLNPIINYAEIWLEEDDSLIGPFRPDLERILKSGKQCLVLIDEILAVEAAPAQQDQSQIPEDARQLLLEQVLKLIDERDRFDMTPAETGRLLVVDDSEVNCDILRRRLEAQGHVVEIAFNGRQALERLALSSFDLVLLDIVMPEMNGVEVLVRLKSDSRLRDVPVIMISALDDIEVVVRCIKLGAEDYLSKPFDPVFLKARIGACLEKRRLREREVSYLAQIEEEKRRADELLHVILPPKIVDELKLTNMVTPRQHEKVAVLFADIVNFTQFCEQHPPEEVVHYLQQLVEHWEDIALRHSVSKIKTIGDAFMAASGLLEPVENAVLNCIHCGLEMIQATQSLPIGWNLRVGIHYGRVVAGVLGRRQYLFDLWGDTVNTASRVESHGVPGSVTLSAEAFSQVQSQCRGRSLGEMTVKGKGTMEIVCFDGFPEPVVTT